MSLKIKVFVFSFFTVFVQCLFAYHVEHSTLIINRGLHSLVITYKICDWKRNLTQRDFQKSCTDDFQIILNPVNESGHFFEQNMDYFDNTNIDKNNGYLLFHQLVVTKVTYENHNTRFRASRDELDDDPNSPLNPPCSVFTGGSALILEQYGDERYHCQVT